ncbi:MAG: TonB-dependent receptor [Gemmatimonadetes bacterium]|nr:TonB-dependent receptor [Gemmatimonadota bacterium]
MRVATSRRGLRLLGAGALALSGLLVAGSAQAQDRFDVVGIVADSSGVALNGAMIVALTRPDSVLAKFSLSDGSGGFKLRRLVAGDYILQVTLVGYQTVRTDFTVTNGDFDAGTVLLAILAIEMEPLVVSLDHVPFVIRRDTLDYNALAFEVPPQATVEDLLKRLPGIEVADDGSITAQGEEVQNVLVDGKEFFGGDPTIATRNLPADAVERIQVYDRQSDMAEFTGIPDGNEERTINLELREDARRGVFGSMVGGIGGGADAAEALSAPGADRLRYNETLSVNRFSPTTQLALLGGANNINQAGFSGRTPGGGFQGGGGGRGRGGGGARAGGSSGFTESLAMGLNASHDFADDTWLRSSYFLSKADNVQNSAIQQQLLLGSSASSLLDRISDETTNTLSHRIDLNAQMEFSDGHDLRVRGGMNVGSSSLTSIGAQETTSAEGRTLNAASSNYLADQNTFGGNLRLTWRKRLNESGRSIVAEVRATLSEPETFTDLTSTTEFMDRSNQLTTEDILQEQSTDGRTLGYSQRLSLTQPVGKGLVLEVFGQRSAEKEDQTKAVYDIALGVPVLNDVLSSGFERTYSYLSGGLRFNRNTTDTRFVVGLRIRSSNLDATVLDRDEKITNGYTHLLPSADLRVQFEGGKNLTLRYTTSTREPSMTELQPFTDNINPLRVYQGNPNLTPEYTHRLRADYRYFDQFTFLNVFAFGQFSYTSNEIVQARTVDEQSRQVITPINTGHGWSANGGVTVGTPIRRLGVSVDVSYNANYSTGTALLNGVENVSQILTHRVDASLENRDKTVFDVRVGGRFTFNNVDYSLNEALTQDYLNKTLYTSGTLYFGNGWTLITSLNYRIFDQEIFGPGQNVAIMNASISRLVMNNRVEVRLAGVDLLNQNQGVSLTNTSAYIQEERIESLGRYLMLRFTYRLGSLGRGGQGGPRGRGGRRGR